MSLCAICDSTNETSDICAECQASPYNHDANGRPIWGRPSEYEIGSEDVDATVAMSQSPGRIESFQGGRRRFDTWTTERITEVALTCTKIRRRRRRNAAGSALRGWETVEEPMTVREIAKLAGCSHEYVRLVLARHRR